MEDELIVILNSMRDEYLRMRTINSTYVSPYEAYAHLQEAVEALWDETTMHYQTEATYRNNMLRAAMKVGAEAVAFMREVC